MRCALRFWWGQPGLSLGCPCMLFLISIIYCKFRTVAVACQSAHLLKNSRSLVCVYRDKRLSLFRGSGKTHYKPITYCYYFLSDNQFVASHRSHESHRERIVTLAFAIRLQTLGKADKLRALCDAASVRFVRSVWNQIFAREEPIGHRLLRHHFRAIL